MKKVLLFLFLINLSVFAQSYINSLYDAIEKNNTKKIIDIVNNHKIDLNNTFSPQYSSFGNPIEDAEIYLTPLIYAIDCRNIEAIDTLLKLGANVGQLTDIYSTYGEFYGLIMGYTNRISITPLMFASYWSLEEVVSLLIKKGAKVNAKNREGNTALMYSAVEFKGLNAAKILINAGANINAKDNKGRTALMYAADNKDEELVDLLIKNKVNVNAEDNDGETALGYACYDIHDWGILNPYIVKSLIRAGANIYKGYLLNAIYTYIGTAYLNLHNGEEELNDYTLPTFEVIKLLINNGANVNIRNEKGETLLSLSKGYPKLTKLLKDNGAY